MVCLESASHHSRGVFLGFPVALPDPTLVAGEPARESDSLLAALKSKKRPRAPHVGVPGDIGGVLIRCASYVITIWRQHSLKFFILNFDPERLLPMGEK